MIQYFTYDWWKLAFGVLVTVGLYSVLWKENKFYRFFEHIFLGLAAGWMLVALWTETLKENWWDLMVGRLPEGDTPGAPGFWVFAMLLPIGLMGYFVFSKKHNWISRIPIGIIIGLWAGQQFDAWMQKYGPQIEISTKPIFPTTFSSPTRPWVDYPADAMPAGMTPETIAQIKSNVYLSQALTNLVALITVLCVLSYFIFSVDWKGNKLAMASTKMGRYLLMVGFGAIFGSTVMMRFSLLIDRMYFVWIEWFKHAVFQMPG